MSAPGSLPPHVVARSSADGPWDVVHVTPEAAGWGYSSLRVADLAAGQEVLLDTGGDEVVVVPLSGSLEIHLAAGPAAGPVAGPGGQDGVTLSLRGRADVFAGPTDVAQLPPGSAARLVSPSGGRVAVAGARVSEARVGKAAAPTPAWVRRAQDVPVELRGAGSCSREVRGLAAADDSTAPDGPYPLQALIAVEVVTPAGNWSSYPPHKHDETSDVESELEEIYYYEVAPGPSGQPGLGYHRTYGTPARPIDVLAEVRSGDTVLVPHGWHGPCLAAPGNHLYYLNVMAGPGDDRAWRIVDDPDHAWVRATWNGADIDPRLPLNAPGGQQS